MKINKEVIRMAVDKLVEEKVCRGKGGNYEIQNVIVGV